MTKDLSKRYSILSKLPVIGFVLTGVLILAERAGLPPSVFTQFFLAQIVALYLAIAWVARTLDGPIFFRSDQSAGTFTQATSTSFHSGLGLLPFFIAPLWYLSPQICIMVLLSMSLAGLAHILLTTKQLGKRNIPDILRLAMPDEAPRFFRLVFQLIGFFTLLSGFWFALNLLHSFALLQDLIDSYIIIYTILGVAALGAILGGRISILHMASLTFCIVAVATLVIGFAGSSSVTGDYLLLSKNMDSSKTMQTTLQTSLVAGHIITVFLVTWAILGFFQGNTGNTHSRHIRSTALLFVVAQCVSVAAFVAIGALAGLVSNFDFFSVFHIATQLQMPLPLINVAMAFVLASLASCLATFCFTGASLMVRGVLPIFISRKNPDGRQLFFARIMILAFGVGSIFAFKEPMLVESAQLLGGAILIFTLLTIPPLIASIFIEAPSKKAWICYPFEWIASFSIPIIIVNTQAEQWLEKGLFSWLLSSTMAAFAIPLGIISGAFVGFVLPRLIPGKI